MELDPGLEHLLLTLQERSRKLPKEQAQHLEKQVVTFTSQLHAVQQLQEKQERLVAELQLSERAGPGPSSTAARAHGSMHKHAGARGAGSSAANKSDGSMPGPNGTPGNGLRRSSSHSKAGLQGEELLLHYFSMTDTLGADELKALASQAGLSQEAVRSLFEKMRGSVRTYLQRMQSRAARTSNAQGKHQQHVAGGAAVTKTEADTEGGAEQEESAIHSAAQRREQEQRQLSALLDASGGVNMQAQGAAAAFVAAMRATRSFEVREAQLAALAATPLTSLQALATPDLLACLSGWLKEGEEDGQHSFNRAVLGAVQKLPLSWALLGASLLLPAVVGLCRSRHARVGAAALSLYSHWNTLFTQLASAAVVQDAVSGGQSKYASSSHRPPASGNATRRTRVGQRAHLRDANAAGASTGGAGVPSTALHATAVQHVQDKAAAFAVALKPGLVQAPGTAAKHHVAPKHQPLTSKPTSVDDIKKQRQKAAAREAFQRMGNVGAAAVTAAAAATANGQGGSGGAVVHAASKVPPGLVALGKNKVPGFNASLPSAKRQALGQMGAPSTSQAAAAAAGAGAGGRGPGTASTSGAAAGAGGGGLPDDGLADLSPEDRAQLQAVMQQKARRSAALARTTMLTQDPALQQEIAGVMLAHEDKALQQQGARAAAAARAQAEAHQVQHRLQGMAPSLNVPTALNPPYLQHHLYEANRPGEHSQEGRHQLERLAQQPAGREPMGPVAFSPAEPVDATPARRDAPNVPWLPTDPEELETQNRSQWSAGVRLPQFVFPMPGAVAGVRPPPPAPTAPFVPYQGGPQQPQGPLPPQQHAGLDAQQQQVLNMLAQNPDQAQAVLATLTSQLQQQGPPGHQQPPQFAGQPQLVQLQQPGLIQFPGNAPPSLAMFPGQAPPGIQILHAAPQQPQMLVLQGPPGAQQYSLVQPGQQPLLGMQQPGQFYVQQQPQGPYMQHY